MCVRQPFAIGGSGSTYVFGFVDSNFKQGMNQDECVQFVLKSEYGKALFNESQLFKLDLIFMFF